MALTSGTRLGPYEIIAPLGAGGMGEVYRARDVRLGREVAVKGLPDAFQRDPERLSRFEREARLLASLNHPGIAGIYGLEESEGVPYLVLELVDGESLADRLARGPMPLREALEVAIQVAVAIHAAHERDVVHRDLKPRNVMITAGRTVKVLDFGLARSGANDASTPADLTASPTVAVSVTGAGVILGTAAYMSPEQARGRPVDRRCDVWAFGCLLFECLSGRQVFSGETTSDVIARILEREPDWNALPSSVPPRLREILRRSLNKAVDERPRDIGALGKEIGAIAQELTVGSSGRTAPAPMERPSLAVLYFENLAKDPESEYFCAGITEDILTDLSKIKGLRVASRNAVQKYRGGPADLPKVAGDLGVSAVLEGSVRRAGDRIRITAQLVSAADGFHLWAERYDRTMEDVFAVQEEIAASIAEALRVALSPSETARLSENRPQDVKAYDLYLKGRELYGAYTQESLHEAMENFRAATDIDPDYALAWAGIADCYGQLCQWGRSPDVPELTRLGLEAARRAIGLNPKLAEGYKAEALNLRFSGDLEAARNALRKAIEVDPRFTPAILNLTVDAMTRADMAECERQTRRAIEIDPQEAFALTWLSFVTGMTRREDEALATTDRIRKISDAPFYVGAVHAVRAWVHAGRNDLAAVERVRREAAADGAGPEHLATFDAWIAAAGGKKDEARRILGDLEKERFKLGAISQVLATYAALRIDDREAAARFMESQLMSDLSPTMARLLPPLHAVLDAGHFAPRRRDAVLVWPIQSPMLDISVHALFREVRIESGLPPASDVRQSGA